jgi:hypothetical protein
VGADRGTSPAPLAPGVLALGALVVAASFVAASAAPLATYAVGLACLGLPHVVSELRYVDARFGARLARPLLIAIGLLLCAVVVSRLGVRVGWWSSLPRLELLLVAGLALPVLWVPGISWAWRGVVLAVVAGLVAGLAWDPLAALVLLAALHNGTPLAFVAERLQGGRRRRALVLGAALFVGLPLALLAGLPWFAAWDLRPFGLELTGQLKAFVPPAWRSAPWAPRLFAAVVFTQCLHYLYVLVVLPAWDAPASWWGQGGAGSSLAPWPRPAVFALALLALAGVSLAVFNLLSFTSARAWYGLAAAVHAWLEVPILLAAPALLAQATSSSPNAQEAPLASADSSSPRRHPHSSAQA